MGKRPLRSAHPAQESIPNSAEEPPPSQTSSSSSQCSRKGYVVTFVFLLSFLYSFGSFELLPSPNYDWVSGCSASSSISVEKTTKDQIMDKLLVLAVPGGEVFASHLEALQAMLDRQEFCVTWDVNTDDWWTHHVDWSISRENETHYCFAPMKEVEKADFFRKLYRVQFEGDCSKLRVKGMWSSGWGADLRNVIETLRYAYDNNIPVEMYNEKGWHYAATKSFDHPVCASKDMYCYFLPMTNCQVQPDKQENTIFSGLPPLEGRPWSWYIEYATRQQTWLRHEVYQYVRHHSQDMGLDALLERQETCASVHVRRSDVMLHPGEDRQYYTIKEYMQGTKEILGKDPPKNIFMLTDDSDAVDEARRDFPDIHWFNMNRTRFKGASGGWENQIPSGDPKTEVVVLLATFRLIQDCPIFIHARSSLAEYMWGVLQEHVPVKAQRVNLVQWMRDHKEHKINKR